MKRIILSIVSGLIIVLFICFVYYFEEVTDKRFEESMTYKERDEINKMITGVYDNDVVFGSRIIPLNSVNHIVWETSTESEGVRYYILNEVILYNDKGMMISIQSFKDRDYESSEIYIKFIKELAKAKKDKFLINIIYNPENSYYDEQVDIDNKFNYTLEVLKENYNIEVVRTFKKIIN